MEEQKQKESKHQRLEYTGLGSSGWTTIQPSMALAIFGRPRVPVVHAERIVVTQGGSSGSSGSSGCTVIIQHAIAVTIIGRPRVPMVCAERIVDT